MPRNVFGQASPFAAQLDPRRVSRLGAEPARAAPLARKPATGRGSRFHIGVLVLNPTGTGAASRDVQWPDAGLATRIQVAEGNLAAKSADDFSVRSNPEPTRGRSCR